MNGWECDSILDCRRKRTNRNKRVLQVHPFQVSTDKDTPLSPSQRRRSERKGGMLLCSMLQGLPEAAPLNPIARWVAVFPIVESLHICGFTLLVGKRSDPRFSASWHLPAQSTRITARRGFVAMDLDRPCDPAHHRSLSLFGRSQRIRPGISLPREDDVSSRWLSFITLYCNPKATAPTELPPRWGAQARGPVLAWTVALRGGSRDVDRQSLAVQSRHSEVSSRCLFCIFVSGSARRRLASGFGSLPIPTQFC